jgi:GxxExxY protein
MRTCSVYADELNVLSNRVIGAALRVHSELGPGLLESAYKACLTFELVDAGFLVQREVPIPLLYRGVRMHCAYRLDLIVNSSLIVEVKAVERLERVHAAQLLSHLRLTNVRLGLLFNFNVAHLRDGVKRVVNGLPE